MQLMQHDQRSICAMQVELSVQEALERMRTALCRCPLRPPHSSKEMDLSWPSRSDPLSLPIKNSLPLSQFNPSAVHHVHPIPRCQVCSSICSRNLFKSFDAFQFSSLGSSARWTTSQSPTFFVCESHSSPQKMATTFWGLSSYPYNVQPSLLINMILRADYPEGRK